MSAGAPMLTADPAAAELAAVLERYREVVAGLVDRLAESAVEIERLRCENAWMREKLRQESA